MTKWKRLARWTVPLAAIIVVVAAWVMYTRGRSLWVPAVRAVAGKRTVEDVLRSYGPDAEARLRPRFEQAGVAYPPARIALLAFKEEKTLELWAGTQGKWLLVHTYPIRAASGKPGPKLREGDRQVPEGLYRIEGLNPNSSYHLSMKLNYPNAFDLETAKAEGRTEPGSDIFIHGKAVSIGCLAMGDEAIEELFVLVARIGTANTQVIIAPNDLRRGKPGTDLGAVPAWVPQLYEQIAKELRRFTPEDRKPAR